MSQAHTVLKTQQQQEQTLNTQSKKCATTMRACNSCMCAHINEGIVAVLRDNTHITISLERALCIMLQQTLQLSETLTEVQSLLSPLNRQKRKVIA